MKDVILYVIILLFSIGSATGASNTKKNSGRGWWEAYGGDSTVAEFQNIARELTYVIKDYDFLNISTVSKEEFNNLIEETQISCGENLILNSVSKEAINYPLETPKRIVLDCQKWKSITLPSNKYRLAIHEFLHLALVDDSTYRYSSSLVRFYQKNIIVVSKSTDDLVTAVVECNLKNYKKAVSEGGSIFYKDEHNLDILTSAIAASCADIVIDLVELGVSLDDDFSLNRTLSYMILSNIYVTKKYKSKNEIKFKLIQALISKNKRIVNFPYGDLDLFAQYSYGDSKRIPSCVQSSTIMHLLAYESNVELMQMLEQLGYSMDLKNTCGETPRSILEKQVKKLTE